MFASAIVTCACLPICPPTCRMRPYKVAARHQLQNDIERKGKVYAVGRHDSCPCSFYFTSIVAVVKKELSSKPLGHSMPVAATVQLCLAFV